MKKVFWNFLLCFFGITLFLTSCSEVDNDSSKEIDASDVQIISALGFNVADITDDGDCYIVEGDIMLEKKWLKGQSSSTVQRHTKHSELISLANQKNITVGFDRDWDIPHWIPEAKQAIDEWNNIEGFKLKFVYTEEMNPDIFIGIGTTITSPGLLQVKYPAYGKAGDLIKVRWNYEGFNKLTSLQRKHAMVHALGHAIGFKHTNESGAIHIQGTPFVDANSVMNNDATFSASWKGFSVYDKKAAELLYPGLKVDIGNFPTYLRDSDIGRGTVISAEPNMAVVEYNWSVGGGIILQGQGTSNITVRIQSPYTFNVSLNVSNAVGEEARVSKYSIYER